MAAPYRVSSLAYGLARMWRAWRVLVPVVLVNALIQALLQWPPFTYETWWLTVLTAALSALTFGVGFALLGSSALLVDRGPVHWAPVMEMLRVRAGRYALWAIAWVAVVWVGLLLSPIGALVVAALTVFLLLAALDGQPNPLRTDLLVIGRRFWRWLVTCVIVGVGLVLGSIVSGFTVFFLRPPLAVLIAWVVGGLLAWWITTAWALVYRSVVPAAE